MVFVGMSSWPAGSRRRGLVRTSHYSVMADRNEDTDDYEERRKVLAKRKADADALNALVADGERQAERMQRRLKADELDESVAEGERLVLRQERRAAADRLDADVAEGDRAARRMEQRAQADELDELVEEGEELILTIEDSLLLSEQARAFRASLPDTDPESPNFNVESIKDLTHGELLAEKAKRVLEDWERVIEDPPTINGRTYDDIINTADYKTELADKHQFRYEATDDADAFQRKMLEMYHGGFMYTGEDKAYRYTRRIHGGPLFHYISNCKDLTELKEFMVELHGFWKKHTESYRIALVDESSISDESLVTSAKSVQHHKKVKEFCERMSKANAREYTENNIDAQELSCIYEMHKVADEGDDANSATVRQKIGKIHSIVKSLANYFYDSAGNRRRRNCFKCDEEDEPPLPTAIDGNILCFIEREGTLFDRSKYPELSNCLVEFIEVFTTAALFPTITICPSIDELGDSSYVRDDPKFFARVQRIVHLIGMNKFQTEYNPTRKNAKRDTDKYSEKEWEELIYLSDWMRRNIISKSNKGELYPNRAEYLEMIGFFRLLRENDPKNQEWRRMFTDLKNHVRVHGFGNWSKAKTKDGKEIDGEKLGIWFRNQRRDFRGGAFKIGSKHRWKYDLLNSINFPW